MKFSEQWLREWVNPSINTAELAEQLTMAGLEVDAIEPAAAQFDSVVIGQIDSMHAHPEADRLNVCEVNIGEQENLSIVCGANNAAVGIKVPTAVVGAKLPNGLKIKKAKLRGVASFGMLCSETELDMAESSEGLMILPDDAVIGQNVREFLSLDDQIIDVDFTPNRGDCLSVAGISREISVLNNMAYKPMLVEPVKPVIDDTFPISIEEPNDCPRYLGRVIKNIDSNATTPMWMQEKLRRAGLRSLSPTVDVTNYVLMELGQPMHAFDLAKLNEKIIIRKAKENEEIKLLDDSEIKLSEDVLVIADTSDALAFAGVMGGANSAVTEETVDIFLECAFFNPDVIRGKARKYGMQTDSSYRFERGVDFSLQTQAMERATQLILEIAGGKPGPVSGSVIHSALPTRETIQFRKSQLDRVLGFEIETTKVESILKNLGMTLENSNGNWLVTPPTYRFDIAIEADLIEEVGRVYGYNQLPTTLPTTQLRFVKEPEAKLTLNQIRQVLVSQGYQEAITYSFVDEKTQNLFDPDIKPFKLSNPISAEMSVMRTTLWTSLIKTAEHNMARQQSRIRLFEIGKRFLPDTNEIRQDLSIAGLLSGDVFSTQWDVGQHKTDFYDIKNDVENLLSLVNAAREFTFEPAIHHALHPGQSAQIKFENEVVGWIGKLHPAIQQSLGLNSPVFLFELSYTSLDNGMIPKYKLVSRFPFIKRDLALVVAENVQAGMVIDEIKRSGGKRLQLVEIFDIYHGPGVEEGKKSLALSLTIQDDTQTLTDQEVDEIIQEILVSLQASIGATLRE